MFAKNKQIFNEIIHLINDGTLSSTDLKEIDAYTKGVTTFSSGAKPGVISDPRYDRMVNYAVIVPKLEEILDGIYSVQEKRETLKIDAAASIEKIQLKEERARIVKPPIGVESLNESLSTSIAQMNSAIDMATENKQNKFPIGAPVSVIGGSTGTVAGYDEDKIEVHFSDKTAGLVVKNYSVDELTNLTDGMNKIEEFVKENPAEGSSLEDALASVQALAKSSNPTVK